MLLHRRCWFQFNVVIYHVYMVLLRLSRSTKGHITVRNPKSLNVQFYSMLRLSRSTKGHIPVRNPKSLNVQFYSMCGVLSVYPVYMLFVQLYYKPTYVVSALFCVIKFIWLDLTIWRSEHLYTTPIIIWDPLHSKQYNTCEI